MDKLPVNNPVTNTTSSEPQVMTMDTLAAAMKMMREHDAAHLPSKVLMRKNYQSILKSSVFTPKEPKAVLAHGMLNQYAGLPIYTDETLPDNVMMRVLNADGEIIYEMRWDSDTTR